MADLLGAEVEDVHRVADVTMELAYDAIDGELDQRAGEPREEYERRLSFAETIVSWAGISPPVRAPELSAGAQRAWWNLPVVVRSIAWAEDVPDRYVEVRVDADAQHMRLLLESDGQRWEYYRSTNEILDVMEALGAKPSDYDYTILLALREPAHRRKKREANGGQFVLASEPPMEGGAYHEQWRYWLSRE